MSPKPRLNEHHVAQVAELLTAHKMVDAAGKLGVTAQTLRKFVRKHGLQPRGQVLFVASSEAVKAYQDGATIEELSKQEGVDRTTLRNALVRQGVVIRKEWSRTKGPLPKDADVDHMAALLSKGMTLRDIGRETGFSYTTVRKYLNARGIEVRRRKAERPNPRNALLAREYGISGAVEQQMLIKQGGRCAICGVTPDSPRNHGKTVLCVDHDHITGKVRGLLCATCNMGLSYFRDQREVLQSCARYLEAHPLKEKEVSCPNVGDQILHYLELATQQVSEGVRVIDPSRWNIDKLVSEGFPTSDIRHALRVAHLKSPRTQWVFAHEVEQAVARGEIFKICDARKLGLREITTDEANALYKTTHLQGTIRTAIVSYGLFDEDGLVAAMSFNTPKICRSPREALLLQRFACRRGCRIRGAAGKLLKAVRSYDVVPILSYSDNRYSDGGLYRALGFAQIDTQDVDYLYYKDGQIFNKSQLQKSRTAGRDDPRTEYEIARSLGYLRIYNAGKRVWGF